MWFGGTGCWRGTRKELRSDAGKDARAYLEGRGLDAAAQEALGLGLYPSVASVEKALRTTGHDVTTARSEGLLFDRMAGFAVFPWAIAAARMKCVPTLMIVPPVSQGQGPAGRVRI